MPNYKHIVRVRPDTEKRLYRVFKEIEMNGESLITDMDKDWHAAMRKMGIRTKKLVDDNGPFIDDWVKINSDTHTVEQKLFRVRPDRECIEIKGNNISFFHFKRRNII